MDFPPIRAEGRSAPIARCDGCIASGAFAQIENDLCELCREYRDSSPKEGKRKGITNKDELAQLHKVLDDAQGRGPQLHDALVMFSGGKDSTYLIHKLRSDYPRLRILAVTIDSGFISPVALENARRVGSQIDGVDTIVFRAQKSLFYRAFRHALTNLRPGSCYHNIDLLDGELTFDIGRNLAASMSIPLFIAGTSTAQLRLLHNQDWFERRRELMLAKRTHTTGGYDISDLTPSELLGYWWDGTRWPPELVPRNILPFHAWDYDEAFLQKEVVRLGYLSEGSDNPLVTNNALIPLMLCVDYARLGYCGFEPEFALLVREGRANRQQWCNTFDAAAHLASTGDLLPLSVDYVLDRLDLRREDVGIPYPSQDPAR